MVSRYAKNNNTETHVAVFEFVNSIKKETHLDHNYTLTFYVVICNTPFIHGCMVQRYGTDP